MAEHTGYEVQRVRAHWWNRDTVTEFGPPTKATGTAR